MIELATSRQARHLEKRARVRRSEISEVDFEISLSGMEVLGRGFSAIVTLRDITKRKAAEREIQEKLRFETLLSELSAKFINLPAEQVGEVIRDGLRRIARHLDLDRASVFEQQGETVRLVHHWAAEGIPATPTDPEGRYPYLMEKLLDGDPLIVPDVDELPPEAAIDKKSFQEQGQRALVAFPVRVGGSILAAVTFGSFRRSTVLTADRIQRLRMTAEVFASALARKRTEQALRESEERFRAMFEASETGLTVRRLDDLSLVAANQAAGGMYGHALEEFLELSAEDYLTPKAIALRPEMIETVRRGDTYYFDSTAAGRSPDRVALPSSSA